MASIWCPGKGACIRDIGSQLYIFQFFHNVDLRRVLEGGPWTFSNHLLILHELESREVLLLFLSFILIFGFEFFIFQLAMSELVGKQLGNFLRKFLDYDVNNNFAIWRSYMCTRVLVDVRQLLKRCKKIRKQRVIGLL